MDINPTWQTGISSQSSLDDIRCFVDFCVDANQRGQSVGFSSFLSSKEVSDLSVDECFDRVQFTLNQCGVSLDPMSQDLGTYQASPIYNYAPPAHFQPMHQQHHMYESMEYAKRPHQTITSSTAETMIPSVMHQSVLDIPLV